MLETDISLISYYTKSCFGIARPEHKINVLAQNIRNTFFINSGNHETPNMSNEDEIENLMKNDNAHSSLFPTFKLNHVTYSYEDEQEQYQNLTVSEIQDLLNNGKTIVVFSIVNNDTTKLRVIVLNEPINITEPQIYSENSECKSIILSEILKGLDGEENECIDIINSIFKHNEHTKKHFSDIDSYYFKYELSVNKDIVNETQEIYDKFIKDNDVKLNENNNNNYIDSIDNLISIFYDNNNPYPYLEYMETFDMNLIKDNDETYNKIITIDNSPIIINKRKYYDKWNNIIMSIEGLNRHKAANDFECVEELINVYKKHYIIDINYKLCHETLNLVMIKLLSDFNPIDFIEKYYKVITTTYEPFINSILKESTITKEESNTLFANQFQKQYVGLIKPEFELF